MPDFRALGGSPFRRVGGKASRGPCKPRSGRASRVETKRGLALPPVRSALATTRRGRPQPSRVLREVRETAARLAAARGPAPSLPDRPDQLGISRQDERVPCPVGPASRHRGVAGATRHRPAVRSPSPAGPHPTAIRSPTSPPVTAAPSMSDHRSFEAEDDGGEDVLRQMAMAVVTAVWATPFPPAVQRIVGRIEIGNDPRRRRTQI